MNNCEAEGVKGAEMMVAVLWITGWSIEIV